MATILTAASPITEVVWMAGRAPDRPVSPDIQDTQPSGTRSGAQAWIEQFRARASRLLTLKPGWDGPGSEAVSLHALYYAEHLLGLALAGVRSPVLPAVVPTAAGGVQLEWHGNKVELEVLIDSDRRLTALLEDHETGAEIEGVGEEALDLFVRWAARASQDCRLPADVSHPSQEDPITLAA